MLEDQKFSTMKAKNFMETCCPLFVRPNDKKVQEFDIKQIKSLITLFESDKVNADLGPKSSFKQFFQEALFLYEKSKRIKF